MKKTFLLIVFILAVSFIQAQNTLNSDTANTSDKADKLKNPEKSFSQVSLSQNNTIEEKKKKGTKMALKDLSGEKTSWMYRPTDNLATVIGYFLVFLASIITACQWEKDQRWKRKDALMNRITFFDGTPGAWNARQMLVSSDRDISLWDKEKPEERYERVTRREVAVSLIPHEYLPIVYSPKESAIRDSFDDFLKKLTHLEVYRKDELLDKKEIRVAIPNWVETFEELIASSNITDKELVRNLFIYISNKKMTEVIELLKTFGILIDDNIQEYQRILKEEIKQNKWQRLKI